MNANELRIGNYYNYDSRPIKLDGGFLAMYLQNETDLYLEPITLNEQWLLDFGFVKVDKMFEFWEGSVFNIELINNHWCICYTSNVLCTHIKHAHQLQNLYFALTGIELIKKL